MEDMERLVDLHTHSNCSDGSMRPAELVRHAAAAGLKALALTDHDTVAGIDEAAGEAERLGIGFIPGVEISVDYTGAPGIPGVSSIPGVSDVTDIAGEMHMLGYFTLNNYSNIRPILEDMRMSRENRNPRIIARLNELGMEISEDEVRNAAEGETVGRVHIAKVLAAKGYVADIDDAFAKYLAIGGKAYFKKDKLSPAEGIAEIRKAGGIPVLAHPSYLGLDCSSGSGHGCRPGSRFDYLISGLKDSGLMGIEAYYSSNTDRQTSCYLNIASKYSLIVTGGTDFHGENRPSVRIGTGPGNLRVPYSVYEALNKTLNSLTHQQFVL